MSSLFVFYDIKKDVGNLTLNLKDSLSHSRMELRNGMNVPHHPLPWIYILTYTILFLPNFQIPLLTCFSASLSHISQWQCPDVEKLSSFRRKAQLLSLWAVLESLSKGQSMGFGIGQTCFQAWFYLPLVCETGKITDPSQLFSHL